MAHYCVFRLLFVTHALWVNGKLAHASRLTGRLSEKANRIALQLLGLLTSISFGLHRV